MRQTYVTLLYIHRCHHINALSGLLGSEAYFSQKLQTLLNSKWTSLDGSSQNFHCVCVDVWIGYQCVCRHQVYTTQWYMNKTLFSETKTFLRPDSLIQFKSKVLLKSILIKQLQTQVLMS
jgi:hypothetical protein